MNHLVELRLHAKCQHHWLHGSCLNVCVDGGGGVG